MHRLRDEVVEQLLAREIPVHMLNQGGDNRNVDGVRLATMPRVKGLMFLAGMNQNNVPLGMAVANAEYPVKHRQNELNERALVHVTASWAVKWLFVSWIWSASVFAGGLISDMIIFSWCKLLVSIWNDSICSGLKNFKIR